MSTARVVRVIFTDRCRVCGDSVQLLTEDGSDPEWRHVLSAMETHDAEPDTLSIRSIWQRYERGER